VAISVTVDGNVAQTRTEDVSCVGGADLELVLD
jgi:hypothetical protein